MKVILVAANGHILMMTPFKHIWQHLLFPCLFGDLLFLIGCLYFLSSLNQGPSQEYPTKKKIRDKLKFISDKIYRKIHLFFIFTFFLLIYKPMIDDSGQTLLDK